MFLCRRPCFSDGMATPSKTSTGRVEASESEATTSQNPTATAPLPRLAYTMRETAEILGVSYITVWRLLKRGKLRASDAIRNKIIARAEIERFLTDSTPEFYFDKTKGDYWRKTPSGEFIKCNETDLKRHCQRVGMNVFFKQGEFGLTRFESAICDAQDNAAVDHAIPLAGHRAGIFTTEDGRKILVPRGPRLIVPKPGEFPNFDALITELFGDVQRPYLFAWLKVMLEDFYRLTPSAWRHHQLLALVGKPDCGKSFFQILISLLVGGRTADPYLWMVGKSTFNEEIAESEHLMMEDKHALRDGKSRAAFGTAIKQLTVTSQTPIHGKGKKMFTAPAFRRLSFSVNEDADYITALPMLDDSISDKLMLFKCSKAHMLPDWTENKARFTGELPAFIHHILHSFTIPDELRHDRFGVVHYHNPEVVELLQQFEPHFRFREALDGTFFKDGNEPVTRKTAAEIQTDLLNGPFAQYVRPLVSYPTACGQLLAKLAKEEPERLSYTMSKGIRRWTIRAPRTETTE